MRLLFIFLIVISFVSCSDSIQGLSKPSDLIPRDSMVLLLKELTLIESHVQQKYLHVSRFHKTMQLSGNRILKKYHISDSRFERSIDYYGSRQEQMQSIYTEILDSLNKDASVYSKDLKSGDSIFLKNKESEVPVFQKIDRKEN